MDQVIKYTWHYKFIRSNADFICVCMRAPAMKNTVWSISVLRGAWGTACWGRRTVAAAAAAGGGGIAAWARSREIREAAVVARRREHQPHFRHASPRPHTITRVRNRILKHTYTLISIQKAGLVQRKTHLHRLSLSFCMMTYIAKRMTKTKTQATVAPPAMDAVSRSTLSRAGR